MSYGVVHMVKIGNVMASCRRAMKNFYFYFHASCLLYFCICLFYATFPETRMYCYLHIFFVIFVVGFVVICHFDDSVFPILDMFLIHSRLSCLSSKASTASSIEICFVSTCLSIHQSISCDVSYTFQFCCF